MTPLNFILTIAVGFLVFRLATQEIQRREDAAVQAVLVKVTPSPKVPATPVKAIWARNEVCIVHGEVAKKTEETLTINCTERYNGGLGHMSGGAGMSAGEQRNLVEEAVAADKDRYGELMSYEGGRWHTATWKPEERAGGTVTVVGPFPPKTLYPGAYVQFVAVPIGNQRYTTRFQVEPEKPGAWMWNR